MVPYNGVYGDMIWQEGKYLWAYTKLQPFCIRVSSFKTDLEILIKKRDQTEVILNRSGRVWKSADTLLLSSGRSEIKNLLKWLLSSSDICVKCYGL